MPESSPITMSDPRGIALVAAVALVYGLIRWLPRLLAGRGGFISVAELRRRIDGGPAPLVLDVREPGELEGGGHPVPGAINVPLGQLRNWLEDPESHRLRQGRTVVTVCHSDTRAALAVRILRRRGVGGARALAGGMDAWLNEGRGGGAAG